MVNGNVILQKTTEPEVENVARDKWSKGCDFILSLIGYGVGLGNIWRFPYLCAKNGGAVFLIPYLIFMILCAFPLCYLEVSLGQFSGKSTYNVWDICPILRGVGVGMTLTNALFCSYANLILSWILYYLVYSFMSPLPWSNCDNWWNTKDCYIYTTIEDPSNTSINSELMMNATDLLTNIAHTLPSEEFWQYNVLRISSGINDFGSVQWHVVFGSAVGWFITFLCMVKGVKSLGKVVYVTATAPYILITIILIRAITLPGALDGVEFYIIPDWSKLLDIQVWVQALMQIFFSLGMGWGGFIAMASYNKFNNNVLRDTIICCVVCEGTSFYAGFVVFAGLGHMAYSTGLTVEDIIRTGPGLAFITYPDALSQLPVPQIWAVLFFIMLVFVALDTIFIAIEVCTTTLMDVCTFINSKRIVLLTGISCLIMFLVTLIYTTNAGVYVFQIVDWYCGAIALFIYTLLECIIVGWIYGADRYYKDLEMMFGKKPSIVMKILWCYITPGLMLVVLALTFYNFKTPSYGDYVYPPGAEVFGWLVATLPILSIPTWMLVDVLKRRGPILQRIMDGFKPNDKWGPARDADMVYNTNSRENMEMFN
ncbi:hypothetical protein LOTGIDRAFT_118264 [Lottia gigantea]|uniref:Transporter n=1 Tax=Lottia gigantea TaxID=225164 RepID=V4AH05_LOTGI|nr:hypothetical protein LOTGIDRAFT_118264 [Lottia gigantea]ESO94430.1 hypothetical protein LOTGIDRAFT_118264 [Lottia gigantea]